MKLKLRNTIGESLPGEDRLSLARTKSTDAFTGPQKSHRTDHSWKKTAMPFLEQAVPGGDYVKYSRQAHNKMVDTATFNFGMNPRTTYSVAVSKAVDCGVIKKPSSINDYTISAVNSPCKLNADKIIRTNKRHKQSHSVAPDHQDYFKKPSGLPERAYITDDILSDMQDVTVYNFPRTRASKPSLPSDISQRRKKSSLYGLMHVQQTASQADDLLALYKAGENTTERNSSTEVGRKYFRLGIPKQMSDSHMSDILKKRLASLRKMSVDEAKEPRMGLKKQTIISKAESMIVGSHEASQAADHLASNTQSFVPATPSHFLHLIVFDRVIFMGSYIVASLVHKKPRSVASS